MDKGAHKPETNAQKNNLTVKLTKKDKIVHYLKKLFSTHFFSVIYVDEQFLKHLFIYEFFAMFIVYGTFFVVGFIKCRKKVIHVLKAKSVNK